MLHAWIPADAIDPELAAQRHSATANSVTYLMEGHDLVQKYMVRPLTSSPRAGSVFHARLLSACLACRVCQQHPPLCSLYSLKVRQLRLPVNQRLQLHAWA